MNWRSAASALFSLNNSDYVKFATPDDLHVLDTGISTINDVRAIKKVYGEKSIKNKKIVYYNPDNHYTASYYYYPFGRNTTV